MKNKKVVITEGADFIGSHLAEELVNSTIKIMGMRKNPNQICEKRRHKSKNINQGVIDVSKKKTKEKLDFEPKYLLHKEIRKPLKWF